jgi:hypothetical protein
MVGADESRFPDQGINGGGQCSCKCCALDECPYRKDPCQTHHAAVHACRLSGLCFVGFVYLTLIQRLTALEHADIWRWHRILGQGGRHSCEMVPKSDIILGS